jgi:hypothetical protein
MRRLNIIISLSIFAIAAISAPFSQVLAETVVDYDWTESHLQAATHRDWTALASSADGSKLAVVVEFDYLYTSADGGSTWVRRNSAV